MKTVSNKVVRNSVAWLSAQIWLVDGDPYLNFWVKLTALERNRRFSIYFRS